jgi:hypothetical protein
LDYIRPKIQINPKYQYWITCLEDLKNRETFQEKYPDWADGLKRGVNNLNAVDLWRNNVGALEDIFSQNPRVLQWWQNSNKKII